MGERAPACMRELSCFELDMHVAVATAVGELWKLSAS